MPLLPPPHPVKSNRIIVLANNEVTRKHITAEVIVLRIVLKELYRIVTPCR